MVTHVFVTMDGFLTSPEFLADLVVWTIEKEHAGTKWCLTVKAQANARPTTLSLPSRQSAAAPLTSLVRLGALLARSVTQWPIAVDARWG